MYHADDGVKGLKMQLGLLVFCAQSQVINHCTHKSEHSSKNFALRVWAHTGMDQCQGGRAGAEIPTYVPAIIHQALPHQCFPACRGDDRGENEKSEAPNGSGPGRPKSKMELIIEHERAAAAAKASKAAANAAAASQAAASNGSSKRIPWLLPGLIVKVR